MCCAPQEQIRNCRCQRWPERELRKSGKFSLDEIGFIAMAELWQPQTGVFFINCVFNHGHVYTIFCIWVSCSSPFLSIYLSISFFSCSYLAENVTIAIPIIGGLLFIFTMSSLLRTSLSDPGIIPRATPEEAAYVEKQIGILIIFHWLLKIN